MKKSTTQFLLLIFVLTLVFGCTVEKRLYEPGYHINWNKQKRITKNKTEKSQHDTPEEFVVEHITIEEETVEPTYTPVKENIEPTLVASNDNSDIISVILKKENKFTTSFSNNIKSAEKSELTDQNNETNFNNPGDNGTSIESIPQMHWGAIAGFLCGIASIFVFGIVLSIAGVIFSAIALTAISENPEKYRGKGLAVAGLIISIICVVLSIMTIAALAAAV